MTAKELNEALNISRKIKRLQGRLDDLRATGGVGGAASNTPVMGGAGGVCAGQIVTELEQEIEGLEKKLSIEQIVIRRYIENLELGESERKLMILRYVDCWEWTPIAQRLCYSSRRVYQLHSESINIAVGCS